MNAITIDEIHSDLSGCLQRVRAGETLTILQDDQPIAELKPLSMPTQQRRPYGLCAGEFTVPDDFDDPLPEDILNLFEGR